MIRAPWLGPSRTEVFLLRLTAYSVAVEPYV